MALAGKKAQVKVSGALTVFTGEATNTSDNLNYQIADSTKEVWCPFCTITVLDGGVPTVEAFTLNRLTGTVTFGSAVARVITLDGQFLPLSVVAEAHEFSYSISAANEDETSFGNEFVLRKQTLKDVSASVTRFTQAADTFFFDELTNGTRVVLEFFEDASGPADIRIRALIATDDIEAAVDGLVDSSLEFEGSHDDDNRVIALL